MSTTAVDQDTATAAPDTGSQLTAPNRSVKVDGDTLVYRRFGNEQTDAAPRWSFCSTFAATSTTGTRPSSTASPGTARSSCSTTAASAPRPESSPTTSRTWPATSCASSTRSAWSRSICSGSRSAATSPRSWRWSDRGWSARLVLAGTAPRAPRDPPLVRRRLRARHPDEPDPDRFLRLFFSGSEESRAKGMRVPPADRRRGQADRDEPTDLATRDAQLEAFAALGDPGPVEARPPGGDHPADVGRQRRQRHDDDHREQPPPRPSPPQRATAHLPRRGPRVPRPVPRQFADHVNAFLSAR